MAEYTLWLTTDTGARIGGGVLNNNLGFSAVKAVNKAAPCRIVTSPAFDTSLIKADRMVQVWRTPTGGHQYLYGVYIIMAYGWEQTADGDLFFIQGYTPPCLLWRRWVAAYAGSAAADKNDLADDMMKEVVTQSMSDALSPSPTAGSRAWANLTVAGDLSDGPTTEKGFAWKQLLTQEGGGVLPSINKASRQLDTEVFFDVKPNVIGSNSINFIFRTYTGQPGIDRTDGPAQVVFSKEQGTLTDVALSYDYTKAQNYIYAAGQGDLDDLDGQVSGATDFLRVQEDELRRLGQFPGLQEMCLDFGIGRRDVAAQVSVFPAVLLWQAGALDIDVVVTHYAVSDEY